MQVFCFFFFNDPATTEIYTLSLHDALPISSPIRSSRICWVRWWRTSACSSWRMVLSLKSASGLEDSTIRQLEQAERSEEHTSELQSQSNLVCRLLLEQKKALSIVDYCVRRL